jgi:hypothetical protein
LFPEEIYPPIESDWFKKQEPSVSVDKRTRIVFKQIQRKEIAKTSVVKSDEVFKSFVVS